MLDFSKFPQASSSLPLILCITVSLSIRFFNFFQLLHIFSTFQFFQLHAWFPRASFSLPLLFCITLSLSIRFFQNGKYRLGDNRRMHIATIIRKAFETEQAAMATEWSELFFGHEELILKLCSIPFVCQLGALHYFNAQQCLINFGQDIQVSIITFFSVIVNINNQGHDY